MTDKTKKPEAKHEGTLTRRDLLKVTAKQQSDFVTEVDKAAENAIIEVLREAYPQHGILAEESGGAAGKGAGRAREQHDAGQPP